jgi:uncharacterized membrane protein YebE (DUF533 family)
MRAAVKTLLIAMGALAMAACQKTQSEQNIAIDNLAANADVEALPPDESSETPSNELVNGADNPEVNDLNASSNSY